MDNDKDIFDIKPIERSILIEGLQRSEYDDKRKKHSRRNPPDKKEVQDNFHDLSVAAETSNDKLADKGLPYRFCIYEDSDEIFIDLVVLDDKGSIIEEKRKNISHQDFSRLIEEIANNEGLFFDGMA